MQRYSFLAIGFSVLAACASGELSPRTAHDPANPRAPEAPPYALPVQTESSLTPEAAHLHGSAAVEASDAGTRVYSCPMHPEVKQATPGTCPKCGMQLRAKDGS